jgi:hypothetical protein
MEIFDASELQNIIKPKKKNKYRARRVRIDGFWFDSHIEGARYCVLKTLERQGIVQKLELHRRYKLTEKHSYVSDFEYEENGQHVTEDSKGFRTSTYKLKAQLMKEKHGITIKETTMPWEIADAVMKSYVGVSERERGVYGTGDITTT